MNATIKYAGRHPTYSNLAIEPEIELFGLFDGKFVWVEAEGATAPTIGMPPPSTIPGRAGPLLRKLATWLEDPDRQRLHYRNVSLAAVMEQAARCQTWHKARDNGRNFPFASSTFAAFLLPGANRSGCESVVTA